jgi:hypothetical protein
MKKTLFYIIAIIPIALFCGHCKKSASVPSLPPITQVGANTFGCLIDGKVWVPHFKCNYFPFSDIYTSQLTYAIHLAYAAKLPLTIFIDANNDVGDRSNFTISPFETMNSVYHTGNIVDSLQISFVGIADAYGISYNYYRYPGLGNNNFTITNVDTIQNIISGTFGLTLYAEANNNRLDSVVITEGRFDLRIGDYSTCSN